ncbi:MAG: galactitol-1-phosphate 5-dehydrogenase [Candidatus Margulisbacteria bacterium]|nr:galactitol-1-phosphate 5-dehydrogenase [Candidatus Margulisiibacteriota bacterium]MBU1617129.1 galactitol-1-phosphate 5-dehydrogenase [Candidatus Margulisiibacteriota bacterium]
MKALVLRENGCLEQSEVDSPQISNGECLIKVEAAGVCSSDIARAFYGGAYRTPLIMGHEIVGTIREMAAGVRDFRVGDRVAVYPILACNNCSYCRDGNFQLCVKYDYFGSRRDGGFAEYLAVPETNLVKIPDNVDFDAAVLVEPAAVALHGVKKLDIQGSAKGLVFGAGPIGNLAGQWLKFAGCGEVDIVDRHASKLKIAEENGLRPVKSETNAVAELLSLSDGGYRYIVEATGSPQLIELALKVVRREGTVLLLGNISGELKLPQALVSSLLRKEIKILGTWNSRIDEWPEVLAAFGGTVRVNNLLSRKVPLSKGAATLAEMKDGKSGKAKDPLLKVILKP